MARLELLFSKSQALRNNFAIFTSNDLRIGKILELTDFIAGIGSFQHASGDDRIVKFGEKCVVVTAFVGKLQFFKQPKNDRDFIIQAYPAAVGSSSIEMRVDLMEREEGGTDEKLIGTTNFVMVARDRSNKAYKVPELNLASEKGMIRQYLAKTEQQKRKKWQEVANVSCAERMTILIE